MNTRTDISREALFNEVKGSLYEYLVALGLARKSKFELEFLNSIPHGYQSLLIQQEQMVRQFYPDLIDFLTNVSGRTADYIFHASPIKIVSIQLMGKYQHDMKMLTGEGDILLVGEHESIPISLKLCKRNAFVNTKSGGVKSFLETYFPWLPTHHQLNFSQSVDREFMAMAHEMHELNDLEFKGDFLHWTKVGKSELPGSLSTDESQVLKKFYARLARDLQIHLETALNRDPAKFCQALLVLMGFSRTDLWQFIYFHQFKQMTNFSEEMTLLKVEDVKPFLEGVRFKPFENTASVNLVLGNYELQIRIKAMNKFTTTSIKINCSVKIKQLEKTCD